MVFSLSWKARILDVSCFGDSVRTMYLRRVMRSGLVMRKIVCELSYAAKMHLRLRRREMKGAIKQGSTVLTKVYVARQLKATNAN